MCSGFKAHKCHELFIYSPGHCSHQSSPQRAWNSTTEKTSDSVFLSERASERQRERERKKDRETVLILYLIIIYVQVCVCVLLTV